MKIPSQRHHFQHPTLLVIANHVKAKLWRAYSDEVEELETLALPRERKIDKETSFVDVDHGSVHAPEPKLEQEHLRHFVHLLASHIKKEMQTGGFTLIHLVMVKDIAGPLRKKLSEPLRDAITRELTEDLTQEHVLTVIGRLYA